MKQPCEQIVKFIIPSVRALIAQSLVEDHGLTQVVVAEKLGITQAAISYYLRSKRGNIRIRNLKHNTAVRDTVDGVTRGLVTGEYNSYDVISKLCKLCEALRSGSTSPENQIIE